MLTRPLYAAAALAVLTNASDPLSYHGGSILALAGRDAAVLVLDKRIGAGNNLIGDECCRVLEASKRALLAVRGIQGDVQSLLEDVAARLRLRRLEEGDDACQEPKTLAALVSVMLYGQRARGGAPGTYATVYRPQRPNPASAYGRAAAAWGTLFACAWIALKVINRENPLRAIGSAFKGVGRRAPPPGATGPGRWVGDRSLGGRQVWVPATADRFRDERKRLEGALDDVPEDANVKPGSATKARGNEKKTSGAAKALPAWWTPPSPQYVPPGRKEALIQVAKAQGATLAAKRVSGAGFSADDIADFRAACAAAGERGCAVKSVGPESARVAIFRAAADFAVTDAMRGQAGATSAFNTPVGPFLVGLSDDLSLDAHKCVSIVMADVAVRVRGAVVQAGAGLRSNDSVATMLELNKLVDLFNTFPFTPDAPELDMLSVGLRSRLSEDERRRICDEFDAISNGEHSAVVRVAVCGASDSAYE